MQALRAVLPFAADGYFNMATWGAIMNDLLKVSSWVRGSQDATLIQ